MKMRDIFQGFYRPSLEDLKLLWKKSLFVLDTNVLLNLYRYPKGASTDLLTAFSQIKDRLWTPYQAALEYQQNRLAVIAEQVSKFDEVRSVLTEFQNNLKTNFGKLQLKKRHSSIAADVFLERIGQTVAEFSQQLDELEKGQPGVADPDKLRDSIEELLEGKVGPAPPNQAALDKIYETGKRRYAEKRPPGYMDDGKEDDYLYGGLSIQRQYGDLLVWEQILEEAGKRKLKHLVFLTDDDKEDWWWIVNSKGKKTIGPRPELVEEISRRADVSFFYMYSSERFLYHAAEYLGTHVKPDTIDQVREVGRQGRWRGRMIVGAQATDIAFRWLQSRYPDASILRQSGYPDFILRMKDGNSLGFEVQYIWDIDELRRRTSQEFYNRLLHRPQSISTPITFIFITADEALARHALDRLQASASPFPFIVGVARQDGRDLKFELVQDAAHLP